MRSLLLFLGLAVAASAAAAPNTAAPVTAQADAAVPTAAPQVIRVGGEYTVESIDPVDGPAGRDFVVVFKAADPSGRFDTLRLESDHVHVAVKVGQKIRLSAEVVGEQGPTAEVSQVVLFLEAAQGRVPVWLLSNKVPAGDLRGSKYLEMHSPTNDYTVM